MNATPPPTAPARPKRTLTRQLTVAGIVLGLLQAGIFALLIVLMVYRADEPARPGTNPAA